MDDSARFDRMNVSRRANGKNPDDVFFHAGDRRQQIKEQIKNLHGGLDRLKPEHRAKQSRRKTGKSR
jgi:hypothetical protein